MKRRELITVIVSLLLSQPFAAHAQPVRRFARIVYFAVAQTDHLVQAFVHGLTDLGYIDGRSIAIEYRFAEGNLERLDGLAVEVARSAPDVIVAVGIVAGFALKGATRSTPIVLAPAGDPVQIGLVRSLAAPEGNITGVSLYASELNQKRLQVLKEAVPGITRVAILINLTNPRASEHWRESKVAGDRLGLEMHPIRINDLTKLDAQFAEVKDAGVDALAVPADAQFDARREQIVQLAADYRLPAIYEHKPFVEAGGLLSYGPNIDEMSYRAASYVDKILKGAKPGDLPIEQPTNFKLIINLKTAKRLGLMIAPLMLARADQVIE
jgi:putative tryptophan/tyrosine transport system substrate-binding protein